MSHQTWTRRLLIGSAASSAVLLALAAPASAAPGNASAYGAKVSVSLVNAAKVNVGPMPTTAVGSPAKSIANVGVPGVLSTGAVNVSATKDTATGNLTAKASVAGVNLGLGDVLATNAGVLTAECSATSAGVVGKSTIANLSVVVAGAKVAVPVNPKPGTRVALNAAGIQVAELILNEQIRAKDGTLTVNALHLKLLGDLGVGDVIIASTTCGRAVKPAAPTRKPPRQPGKAGNDDILPVTGMSATGVGVAGAALLVTGVLLCALTTVRRRFGPAGTTSE